jgi:hypothetical protein
LTALTGAVHQYERNGVFRAPCPETLQLSVPANVTALVKLGDFFVTDFS